MTATLLAVTLLAAIGQALAGATPWSAPAALQACPALEGARVLFPSDKPDHPTGAGAVIWRASPACPGGEGVRVAPIGSGDLPGGPGIPAAANGHASGPRGALTAAVAPHGQLLLAGSSGAPVQGSASGPFAPLGGLAASPAPIAATTAYLGDVALATPSSGGRLRLYVERYFAHRIDRSTVIESAGARSAQALAIAMDFRTDALAAWVQGGSIYARDMPASGHAHSIQRLAPAGADPRIAALLSDDNRAILAWSEESKGETSIYVDRSHVGVRFGVPTLLERFVNPGGLPSPTASPELVRLSSESVMMAWSGAGEGHWVVRTAAIDLQGIGAPTTVSSPSQNALLADLATGPDGDALLLWTQPQQSPVGTFELEDQAIFAARGFDAYPKRTIFGQPEEVAPTGPNSAATVALDPASDQALALWRGPGNALQYAIRSSPKGP